MSLERRIDPTDYHLIKAALTELVQKLKRSRRKAMYQFLSVDAAMNWLFHELEHVYIVANYLVAYELGNPGWASEDVIFLYESLVLKLAVSGDTSFAIVPEFLERKALEAGARLAVVGTALAKADAALASIYQRDGFQPEATTLTKEPGVGGLVKLVTGKAGKKAAKIQAKATIDSANMQAAADRVTAQGAQQATETMLAQRKASDAASELLSVPQDQIDVNLAANTNAEVDPATGRKRSARSSFMSSKPSGSGIRIR